MIAALFVDPQGVYSTLPNVECWGLHDGKGVPGWIMSRDARSYTGPHPVVCHPPCQRWGRFWHGSTRKPHQFRMGEDGGCFAAALTAVRNYGGVLEHPADSHAWRWFGLTAPMRGKGWQTADSFGGWTCCVDQGHYGHFSNKRTWLYACKVSPLPGLDWTAGKQRLPQAMIDRYGYEKARRIGVVAMIGGKDKTKVRNATPRPFAELLVRMANSTPNRVTP